MKSFGKRITKRLHELIKTDCAIKDVLQSHLKGISEYESFYMKLISESNLLHEGTRVSLIMIQSAISFHIVKVAEREMQSDKIKIMPVNLLFNTWVGLIHHYLINRDLFAPNESVIEKFGQQLIDHYMNLIML